MKTIFTKKIMIEGRTRTINVLCGDLTLKDTYSDLLLCSSYVDDHTPTIGTMMYALSNIGIDVELLSKKPKLSLNLNDFKFWISKELNHQVCKYLGCIEMMRLSDSFDDNKRPNPKAMFSFLETILSYDYNLGIKSISLPLFGTGYMKLPIEEITPHQVEAISNALYKNKELVEINFFGRTEPDLLTLIDYINKIIFANEYDVFISHSSIQNDLALEIQKELISRGKKVWVDKNTINGGDSFGAEIMKGIRNSKILLLLLSKEAADSVYVLNEVVKAFNYKKHVIPYKVGDFELNDLFDFQLATTQILFDSDMNKTALIDYVCKKSDELK